MRRFGGTCPMCCGDLGKDGTAVCVFCGFTSGTDYTAKDAPGISAWLQDDMALEAPYHGHAGRARGALMRLASVEASIRSDNPSRLRSLPRRVLRLP